MERQLMPVVVHADDLLLYTKFHAFYILIFSLNT